MKKNYLKIMAVFALVILIGFGNIYISNRNSTYHPPQNCKVELEMQNVSKKIYLDVNGLNSTVFCRRVIAELESDILFKAKSVEQFEDSDSFCSINGDSFTVTVFSKDERVGKYFCKILIGSSISG